MAEPEKSGPAAEGSRGNDLASRAKPFIERIERLDGEIDSLTGEHMAACKELRADIKEVVKEAKGAGINAKALKGIIKQRKLQRKIDAIDTEFDLDESAQFDALALAFGDTPFGRHAKERAEQARGAADDDNRDLRPRHLRQPGASAADPMHAEAGNGEAARPDEAQLAGMADWQQPQTDASVVDELAHAH